MNIIKKINSAVFFITMFCICFMFSITNNGADLDLWHRMAVGRIFWQAGNVIYHDIFSYFPTKPLWVDHEWLSGVVFYNLGKHFGDWGILSLKILILFSILLFIHKTNKLIFPQCQKQRITYYFVVIIAIIIGLSATLRCQAFTYLFFTLWIYLLERIRRGENRLMWIFPAITAIWANMHAGFIAGFGLIGFYAVGEFLNWFFSVRGEENRHKLNNFLKFSTLLGFCIPITLINPYGIKYWHYLVEAITMPRPFITEWLPLEPFKSFWTVIGTKIQVIMVLPGIIYSIYKAKNSKEPQKLDWVEIIAFFATLYMCIKHVRHVLFFSIILAVFGYKYFVLFADYIFEKFKIRERIFSLIPEEHHDYLGYAKFSFVYSFILTICFIVITQTPHSISVSFYPTKAIEFIKLNSIEGNLLVPFNWGSYAMWKLYPQNLVSIDGRYEECYTNEAYMNISIITYRTGKWDKELWDKTFEKYHHDVILLDNNTKVSDLIRAKTSKGQSGKKVWIPVYEDKQAIVFIPASEFAKNKDEKWIQPRTDDAYYIRTKYQNTIDF